MGTHSVDGTSGTGSRSGRSTLITIGVALAGVLAVGLARPAILRGIVGSPRAIGILLGVVAATIGWSVLLRRIDIPPPVRAALVVAPVLVVLGLTVAPYFAADRVVDEALPVAAAPAAEPEGDTSPVGATASEDPEAVPSVVPDAEGPAVTPGGGTSGGGTSGGGTSGSGTADGAVGTTTASVTPAPRPPSQQAPQEAQVPQEAQEAQAPQEAEQTPPTGPVERSRGTFMGLDGHRASGEAAVYELGAGRLLVRLEDVDLQRVPDAHVYLVPSTAAQAPGSDAVYLGPLTGNVGSSNYDVPEGTVLSAGATVLVWCEAFASPVGAADQS